MGRFALVWSLSLALAGLAFPQHRGDTPPPLQWDKLKGSCPESLDWASLRGNVVVVSIDVRDVFPQDITEWNNLARQFETEPAIFIRVVYGSEFLLDQALKKTAYRGCILFDSQRTNLENFKLETPGVVIIDKLGFVAGYSSSSDESLIRSALNDETDSALAAAPPELKHLDPSLETSSTPSYEVHISPAQPHERFGIGGGGDARYVRKNQPLNLIIMDLWDTPLARITFPENFDEGRYDINAYIPVEDRELLLNLVREAVENRFGLRIERETRTESVYILIATGKASSQLQPANDPNGSMSGMGQSSIIGTGRTAADIASTFQGLLHAPVIDKTGWKGKFDYSASSTLSGPDGAFDMAHQLGLELTPSDEPVDMLIVKNEMTSTPPGSTDPQPRSQ